MFTLIKFSNINSTWFEVLYRLKKMNLNIDAIRPFPHKPNLLSFSLKKKWILSRKKMFAWFLSCFLSIYICNFIRSIKATYSHFLTFPSLPEKCLFKFTSLLYLSYYKRLAYQDSVRWRLKNFKSTHMFIKNNPRYRKVAEKSHTKWNTVSNLVDFIPVFVYKAKFYWNKCY